MASPLVGRRTHAAGALPGPGRHCGAIRRPLVHGSGVGVGGRRYACWACCRRRSEHPAEMEADADSDASPLEGARTRVAPLCVPDLAEAGRAGGMVRAATARAEASPKQRLGRLPLCRCAERIPSTRRLGSCADRRGEACTASWRTRSSSPGSRSRASLVRGNWPSKRHQARRTSPLRGRAPATSARFADLRDSELQRRRHSAGDQCLRCPTGSMFSRARKAGDICGGTRSSPLLERRRR